MTTKQQILKILKDEKRPLKAFDISFIFFQEFNLKVNKKEINQIIHHQLKGQVKSTGFAKYTFVLTEKEISPIVEINKEILSNNDLSISYRNTNRALYSKFYGLKQEIEVSDNLNYEKLIVAICELHHNHKNLDLLKKLNRIIENEN